MCVSCVTQCGAMYFVRQSLPIIGIVWRFRLCISRGAHRRPPNRNQVPFHVSQDNGTKISQPPCKPSLLSDGTWDVNERVLWRVKARKCRWKLSAISVWLLPPPPAARTILPAAHDADCAGLYQFSQHMESSQMRVQSALAVAACVSTRHFNRHVRSLCVIVATEFGLSDALKRTCVSAFLSSTPRYTKSHFCVCRFLSFARLSFWKQKY